MASMQNQPESHPRPSSPPSRTSSLVRNRRRRAGSVLTEEELLALLNDPTSYVSSSSESSSDAPEARKCWICLATETEDTPTSSTWRTPCPCALTAHERCLLDWVTQLDHQDRRRKKIECPQCKAEITIARPRSYLLEGILSMESAGERLVIPIILVTVAGGILAGFWLHGWVSVLMVFGVEDAQHLLGFAPYAGKHGSYPTRDLFLPLIPVCLVASRITLADSLLRALPIFLLYTHVPAWSVSTNLWPPSAAVTFAALPYVRGAYNALYEYIFASRKKAWLKELEPRGAEHDEGPANADHPAPEELADNAHAHVFEIGVDIQLVAEEDVPDELLEAGALPALPVAEDPPAAQAQAPPRERPHLDIVGSPMSVADKVVGALMFPALSAAMGELLKLTLPYTWRTPPQMWERRGAGFLQTRWGRSVVGGCLIVLLKDTAVLYSRYRLARIQRERTVVDWPGRRRRSGAT